MSQERVGAPARQRWEYWAEFVTAEAEGKPKHGLPRYSPHYLASRLDALGEAGWELVHMQPVIVGSNQDVLMLDTMRTWTHTYFCVFKRPRPT